MRRPPHQLLELTLISAQDLPPVARNLRTYAIAWTDPARKFCTRVDHQGQANPSWNDRFVFRVSTSFLNSEDSALTVEVYAQGWLRDTLVGSARVLISDLIPVSVRQAGTSWRFVKLQILRPSGRPQGFLNTGVALMDNTTRSMPLDKMSDAAPMEFQDEKLIKRKKGVKASRDMVGKKGKEKIQLKRSLSDQTDMTRKPSGVKGKKKGGSSVCNGSIQYYAQDSILNCNAGGASVVGGGSIVENGGYPQCNSDIGPSASVVAAALARGLYPTQTGPPPKPGSSVVEDWKLEENSMEGLKSKIERWRMDVPQKYDNRPQHERLDNNGKGRERKRSGGHRRRKTVGDDVNGGAFTCFGSVCGCEFTIVCGSNGAPPPGRKMGPWGYASSKASASGIGF